MNVNGMSEYQKNESIAIEQESHHITKHGGLPPPLALVCGLVHNGIVMLDLSSAAHMR
jgi:hypothetical protein